MSRNDVTRYIEDHNIQTRLLFGGNITRQPLFCDLEDSAYRIAGELTQTDRIMNSSFWVGVYPGMTDEKVDYMAKIITEAVWQI